MNKRSLNPIAVQSQERIIKALMKLMERKDFSDITMQMIADKGKVGRRTIYSHFSSKEDILECIASKVSEMYVEQLNEEENLSHHKIAEIFFSFFNKNIDVLKVLHRNNLMLYLLDRFDKNLNMMFSRYSEEYFKDFSDKFRGYYIAFYSGCYWKLLCEWLDNGAEDSPEEMADILSLILSETLKY